MYTFLDVFLIILSIITIIIINLLIKGHRRPIFGLYQRPEGFYWLKVAFIYVILSIRQYRAKRRIKNTPIDVQFNEYKRLDCPQKLSWDENAIDAAYFNCSNESLNHLIVGTARRKNKLVDGFVYLKLDDFGLLESPRLPSTTLYQDVEKEEFSVEGIKLYPIESMKRWKILYDGKMKKFNKPDEMYDVKIDVTWKSYLPYFNFDNDMDPFLMAKCMAREQWNREYFNCLKEVHQTHYEQYGDISGEAIVNGKTYKINMSAMRDHSFGLKRNWRSFHRYGIHFLSTKNGDKFNVGIVSMPICFSRLVIGYMYCAADKTMYAIEDCDLKLYQHGENGVPPLDYAFSFTAGGRQYVVEVDVIDSPEFYISKDWEGRIVERLCKFKVNGINGWGAAEWMYRNIEGRK